MRLVSRLAPSPLTVTQSERSGQEFRNYTTVVYVTALILACPVKGRRYDSKRIALLQATPLEAMHGQSHKLVFSELRLLLHSPYFAPTQFQTDQLRH